MNERIKQLADEAGLVRNGDFGMKRWEGARSDSITDQDLEKFAELIVRECVGMLDDEDDYGYESRGVRNAAYRIKKRFGVEE